MADIQATQGLIDPTKRYVRICEERLDGFIEFEFSIGDPELCVELMLPKDSFEEFCHANEVVMLEAHCGSTGDWVARMNKSSMSKIKDAG